MQSSYVWTTAMVSAWGANMSRCRSNNRVALHTSVVIKLSTGFWGVPAHFQQLLVGNSGRISVEVSVNLNVYWILVFDADVLHHYCHVGSWYAARPSSVSAEQHCVVQARKGVLSFMISMVEAHFIHSSRHRFSPS